MFQFSQILFVPWFMMLTICTYYSLQVAYSSMNKFSRLLDTETILIHTLDKYVQAETQRLEAIEIFGEDLKKKHNEDVDEFASNPLAIFKTIKHLTSDYETLKKYVTHNSYETIMPRMLQTPDIIFPTTQDLHGIIRNLINLQRVYNVSASDIISGKLTQDISSETALSAEDGLHIGRTCVAYNDHQAAIEWLEAARSQLPERSEKEAIDLLAESYFYTGDKKEAFEKICHTLGIEFSNRRIYDIGVKISMDLDDDMVSPSRKFWLDHFTNQYECFKLCAGDYNDEIQRRNLKCKYNHHNSSFLRLAPLKEEELFVTPKISIFREAIYDSEITKLKYESFNLFKTATVYSSDGQNRTADVQYRPSQTAFIFNSKTNYPNLYRRLEDTSALSMKDGEALQLIHYSPGGYYRVHTDYLPSAADAISTYGNRLATALLYLNDVTLGGETVFPKLKIRVQPTKGSILFWHNEKATGEEDKFTMHAACPVIYGEKFACTQWFRESGQANCGK